MNYRRFDSRKYAHLRRFVGGHAGFILKQSFLINEIIDPGSDFFRQNCFAGEYAMQNLSGADVDSSQVNRYLIDPVLFRSAYAEIARAQAAGSNIGVIGN